MIKIQVTNTKCQIFCKESDIGQTIVRKLDKELSYQLAGYEFASGYSNWDGRVKLLSKNLQFPIGLLSRASRMLESEGLDVQIEDLRKNPRGAPLKVVDKDFKARDYQLEVVDIADRVGSGIIRMCTGSGKTSIIALLAGRFNVKTVIYVIGIELLYQMKKTVETLLGVKCGMIGDGICDIVPDGINICTIWTAAQAFGEKIDFIDCDLTANDKKFKHGPSQKAQIQKVVREAEMFILDECQYAASKSLQFLHRISERARYRFLLSGTPWREMGDDLLIEAVAGPKFYDLPASKLIEAGFLVAPKIFFINVPKMSNLRSSTYPDVYTSYVTKNVVRNQLIVDTVKDLVSQNKKVLVLISKVEHGEILHAMMDGMFRLDTLNGSSKSEVRMGAINSMIAGDLDVLIASKIFDQGIDIPQLDALVLAGSGKSSGRALQRVGRVIRASPGKKFANVIEFWDNAKYLESHSAARLDIYKSEPGFLIKIGQRTMEEQAAPTAGGTAAKPTKPRKKKDDGRGVLPKDSGVDWC